MKMMSFNDFSKIFLLLSLALLFGCVSLSKDEQTENLIEPPSLSSSIDQSLQENFFAKGNWPERNWWEVFQSEQLNVLIQETLQKNPSIQAVERQIEYAKQTSKVARSKLFPLVFFDFEESWQYLSHNGLYKALNPQVSINPNLLDLTLSFSYEFDFWGKNKNLFRAALGQSKAQEAEASQVELITTTALAQAYFALKTNILKQTLYQRLQDVRLKVIQLEHLLENKALLSKLTPLLSNENLLEAEKLLLSIEEEISTNKHLVNILVGRGPDFPLEIDEQLLSLPEKLILPANLSIDLLSRRPDLMAQIWRVEALAHEVRAAKADFLPNINLSAFAGFESTFYRLLFKSSSETAGLQPAIHLPIFTAGAIRANVRAKKAQFDQAIYEYNQLILRSAQEVTDLLAFAKSIFKQKKRQEQIVAEAQLRFDLTTLRQRKGLDSLLSCYALEVELIEKQLTNISLLYSQYLATIKLIKSLGGGYHSFYSLPLKKDKTSQVKE